MMVMTKKCEVKVCDIIQLFLAGYDDKIYLNLSDTSENYILSNERIISSKWISYYECNILYLLDDCVFNSGNLVSCRGVT